MVVASSSKVATAWRGRPTGRCLAKRVPGALVAKDSVDPAEEATRAVVVGADKAFHKTATHMAVPEHIDLDVSALLTLKMTLDAANSTLLGMMERTLNGRLTAADLLGHDEYVLTKLYRSAERPEFSRVGNPGDGLHLTIDSGGVIGKARRVS